MTGSEHATAVEPTRQRQKRLVVLSESSALLALIAVLDWWVSDTIPLGWLYLLPMTLAATVLGRSSLLLMAAMCMTLAELFDGYTWNWLFGVPRDVLYFSAFAGAALFVHGMLRNRRAAAEQMRLLQATMAARQDAEEQLRVLVEHSPVAVFTANADGAVLLANEAADRLFALESGGLTGRSFGQFLPPLLDLPALQSGSENYSTAMQCRGHRANGEIFQADVWFSTYATSTGPRLAVFVADGSEDLRDREEASLQQLLSGSRILVGAVSHEVRNVCGAIAVVHENLRRTPALAEGLGSSKDFEALGTLVLALERIASVELGNMASRRTSVELASLLEEVQIVIAPSLREQEIALLWDVPSKLPAVWADRQSLLQVLLNLVKNSEHALEPVPEAVGPGGIRNIGIQACATGGRVFITVTDTGPGVPHPEFLFRPFQQQARVAGLGLYLSRAMMRSFSGELRYIPAELPTEIGARFIVDLTEAPAEASV
jgi:two-component system sensor kinase FixL